MEHDNREQRLRSHFAFMMVWTGLTIGVFGYLLGILLEAVIAATGFFIGFALSEPGQAAAHITGHVVVGLAVLLGLIQSYMAPDGLPDARPGDE